MKQTILPVRYISAIVNLSASGQCVIFKETLPAAQPVYDDNGLFVSPSGNNVTGDGTIAKPFATVLNAHAMAQPGQTIMLHEGIYREREEVHIHQRRITLRSHRGERAVCYPGVSGP